MARILFTKKVLAESVSSLEKMGIAIDYQPVISTCTVNQNAFSLLNKSLIFTSVNAVEAFFKSDFIVEDNTVYCVGIKTAQALKRHGILPKITSRNAAELADVLKNHKTEDFIHFCGDLALTTLKEEFNGQRIPYRQIVVYKTILLYPKINEKYEALVFFSPSGVRSFAGFNNFEGSKLFAIGETTAAEIKKFSLQEVFTSPENNLEDLVEVIKREFAS